MEGVIWHGGGEEVPWPGGEGGWEQVEQEEEEEELQELPKFVREARTREAAEPRPNLASPSFFDTN